MELKNRLWLDHILCSLGSSVNKHELYPDGPGEPLQVQDTGIDGLLVLSSRSLHMFLRLFYAKSVDPLTLHSIPGNIWCSIHVPLR